MAGKDREIVISRVINAPRELWWGPKGFTDTIHEMDLRVGGRTKVTGRMVFPSAEERNKVVKEFGAIEGGKQTLGRLAAYLEPGELH